MTIVVNDERVFIAGDRFTEKSSSPNAGEFDVQEIISHLPLYQFVKLALSLTTENPVEILLPATEILERQKLAKS